ncbi:acetyl-CoA acetyltransferase, cytosolic-like [Stomoxys calcitrans]|uniref:acetyl-CoA acetyltransferase, cytosolic-like n=1 Tax=Stomoxys calcitrans TaxID=35570 RepID=UPI0027E26456|nr:acetyl-CoA acetyltransferase, cytosolic-like [Stomoxys calcitrans]
MVDTVYIVAATRTPIGNFNGSLSMLKASDLGGFVIKELLKRSNVDANDVDEVIMGQALMAGERQNPARQASSKGGLPFKVPAYNINMLCGSGLKTVVLGYQSICCGHASIVICGGQENMSGTPHAIYLREGIKQGTGTMFDTMLHDCLIDPVEETHMGITAEWLAKDQNISREEQDQFALRSQHLAEKAQQNGYFDKELTPVTLIDSQGTKTFDKDEFIKLGTKYEKLQKLKPCFIKEGTVTPGNACGINDSAAAVLLMSKQEVEKRKLVPLAKIVAWAQTGLKPIAMGLGPVSAINSVLVKANWSKEEVDLFEINEAFAAQSLAVVKCLKLDESKVNINGGAIALGHPIGASGTRILVTLLYGLERINGQKGIASLCIGGGMGIAMAVERV